MKTHASFSITFFRKSHRLWDNVEKYSGDRGATNYVTIWRIRVAYWISKAICTYAHAHAHALRCIYARKQAQTCTRRPICNTWCFFTAKVVSWTRLNVTLYVHCLSYLDIGLCVELLLSNSDIVECFFCCFKLYLCDCVSLNCLTYYAFVYICIQRSGIYYSTESILQVKVCTHWSLLTISAMSGT
jgi:hypothetical protein